MASIQLLLSNPAFVDLPNGLTGWLGWLTLLVVNLLLLRKWWGYHPNWGRKHGIIFILLFCLVPVTNLLIPGIRFSTFEPIIPEMIPRGPFTPTLMVFAALPWVLAAGLLGPAPAAGLAALSGIILAFWESHNPFLPLELALLATLFSAAMFQRYRTPFYRLIRHPLAAAILLASIFPLLLLLDLIFDAHNVLASRLDIVIAYVGAATMAMGGGLFIAGAIAEGVTWLAPKYWGSQGPLRPSPAEKRLEARFLYSIAPFALALALTLMIGDWIVAGAAARQMLQDRMANAAEMAVQNIPFFLETGQNLILQFAEDPRLLEPPSDELQDVLAQDLRRVPYFSQLILLDAQGGYIASHPALPREELSLSLEEMSGIALARSGVPIQIFTVPPVTGARTAQISFLSAIGDENRQLQRVLIGRSDLASNPFGQPLLTSLESMASFDGEGILLDESSRILHHPDPELVMTGFSGQRPENAQFFTAKATDGTNQFVYYQPVSGRPWAVVLTAPARYAQQQALNIAAPLLGMILILSLLAVGLIRLGVGVVTASLHRLAVEADHMAAGKLDQPSRVGGEDEVGQLSRAFEKMRGGLKARMDELNRLLLVSQGVASSLELERSLKPVLEAGLVTGASATRVVLAPEIVPEVNGDTPSPTRYGMGPASDLYRNLDDQILALVRQRDRVLLTNVTRPRLLIFSPGYPRPQALAGVALRRENQFYGTIWVAFDEPHQFSSEEVNFLATLASQAALAASNARLFLNAEIGRQRLEAILASTPDPVIVTDQNQRLLLVNPAAWQVLGLDGDADIGKPIDRVLLNKQLVSLLSTPVVAKESAELVMTDGRVYLATVSSMHTEGYRMGRVCILRDITHFKELDALKSEFVSTVSHDLRSPLTLLRGYTTMLQMVGELNEQQTGYVQKIVEGVEKMARLVNNLLDLGRIEAGVGLQLEMLQVTEIVEQVIKGLQLQAAQKRIRLSSEIPQHNPPLIEADQALLQQVLHNLVENAIKYTDTGGEVKVRIQVRVEEVVFEVHDTGIGIAPADQQRLFEKFYRATPRGAQGDRGSGLGLAIVKSIAERHGGRVWVESQLGKGSTFYLAIPIRQPQPQL
jgi:PAS domain S-box-containing protein